MKAINLGECWKWILGVRNSNYGIDLDTTRIQEYVIVTDFITPIVNHLHLSNTKYHIFYEQILGYFLISTKKFLTLINKARF